MLSKLNTSPGEKPEFQGIGYDKEKDALKMDDVEKLNSLAEEYDKYKEKGLSHLQLPMEELAELPPLPRLQTDTEELPVIDSLREVAMKIKTSRWMKKRLQMSLSVRPLRRSLDFSIKATLMEFWVLRMTQRSLLCNYRLH
jgi:hypothetical protein